MSHPDYSSDGSDSDDGVGLSLSAETMAALRDFALSSGIPALGAPLFFFVTVIVCCLLIPSLTCTRKKIGSLLLP